MILGCKRCGSDVEVPDDTMSVTCSECTRSMADSIEANIGRLKRALGHEEIKRRKNSNAAHRIRKEIDRLKKILDGMKEGSNE